MTVETGRSRQEPGIASQRPGGFAARIRALPAFVLAFFFVFLLPAAALEAAPTVIKLWDHHVHDKKFRQQIFKEFNKENPDIKVEYTSQIGDTMKTLLDAAFRSDTPPDIFNRAGLGEVQKGVDMGWIQPIDDLAPSKEAFQKWLDRFPQGQQAFMEGQDVINGKVYSWPTTGEAGRMMLFWNTKLFQEAGLRGSDGGSAVPETWADLRQFAKKITALGQGKVYGLVFGAMNDRGVWDMNLHSSLAVSAGWYETEPGYGWNYKTGRFDFERGFKKAVQLLVDIRNDGSIFPGELAMGDEQAKFKFSQDLAGMIFGGSWVPGGLLAITTDLQFDCVLPPTEEKGVRKGYALGKPLANNWEYMVSAKSKNREALWKVVDFMTSQRYQEEWVKAGGGISVFPAYNKPEFFPHPTVGKIAQMGATGKRTVPQFPPGSAKVWQLFVYPKPDPYDIIEGFWIGKLGWDAWDELARKENDNLDIAFAEARKQGSTLTRADFTFPDFDPTENYPRSAASSH